MIPSATPCDARRPGRRLERATEAAITELEAGFPYPLTRAAGGIKAAPARRSFHARVTGHLSAGAGE